MIQRTLLTGDQRYVCPDRVMLPPSVTEEPAVVVQFGLADEQVEHTRMVEQSAAILRQLGHASVKGLLGERCKPSRWWKCSKTSATYPRARAGMFS